MMFEFLSVCLVLAVVATVAWLTTPSTRPPRVSRIFDAREMGSWGNNIEILETGLAVIYTRRAVDPGDILIDRQGREWTISSIDTPRDPGDQHFVKLVPNKKGDRTEEE